MKNNSIYFRFDRMFQCFSTTFLRTRFNDSLVEYIESFQWTIVCQRESDRL